MDFLGFPWILSSESSQADTVSVVPKVAGYVTALHVTDNSHFKANDLLVEIDPRDFEDALRTAEANLQSAEASKANALERLSEQTHVITAAQDTVDSDRATLEFAQQQLARYTRASCAWAESEWDSRIGEILIQPAGWAEASRRWQSRIRKICATG